MAKNEQIGQLESLIRQGKIIPARNIIDKIKPANVPLDLRYEYSVLSRRVGLPRKSLKLLVTLIRDNSKRKPTEKEKVEYAASLNHIGAYKEAMDLLEGSSEPTALVHLAFGYIRKWNYGEALKCLDQFLKLNLQNEYPYLYLVAQLNFAECLGFQNKSVEALGYLESINIPEGKNFERSRSYFNELKTQIFINQGEFKKAKEQLSKVKSGTVYKEKWEAFIKKAPMKTLKKTAIKNSNWELARDIDYLESINTKNSDLFWKAYFGTPYDSYRERILKNKPSATPNTYVWKLGASTNPMQGPPIVIDLTKACLASNPKTSLTAGSVLHKLFDLLCSDFYRPFSDGYLYSKLYGNEYYDPVVSFERVYNVILRLNAWFDEHKIPLTVLRSNNAFNLKAHEEVHIVITRNKSEISRSSKKLEQLKECFKDKPFTTKEASNVLNFSLRSTSRLLKDAAENSEVNSTGSRRSQKYSFSA